MNSFKDPFVPLIDNPVNIDRPIQSLQQAIAGLGWLDKCFGRAYESRKINPATKQVSVYPQVWQGLGMDLLEVLPNDNLKSQCFFKVEEPIESVDWRPQGYNRMRAKVSIIFWFNLERIDPTIDYSYAELLKGQVQRLLTTHTFQEGDGLTILRTWETAKQVFAGYTLQEVRDQELIYPWGGFRFDCEIQYIENCPDSVYGPAPSPPAGRFRNNQYLKVGDTNEGLTDDLKIVKDNAGEASPLQLSKTKLGIGGIADVETLLNFLSLPTRRMIYKKTVATSLSGNNLERVQDFFKIPANTIQVGDIINVVLLTTKTNLNGTYTARVRINTTPDLSANPGLAVLATQSTGTVTVCWVKMTREIFCRAVNSQILYNISNNSVTDITTSAALPTEAAIDFTVDQYLMITTQATNSADLLFLRGWYVEILR